jgi:hypothetical protein
MKKLKNIFVIPAKAGIQKYKFCKQIKSEQLLNLFDGQEKLYYTK